MTEETEPLRLLDTPQWRALTAPQKTLVGRIAGNGGTLVTAFTPGSATLVRNLVGKGLISATWAERTVTLEIRADGWQPGAPPAQYS